MNKRLNPIFILFLLGGTIFLTISFYNNPWKVVEPSYYRQWERTYERVVIARLAASKQKGIFTGGGLLGLANAREGWDFDPDRQYTIYEAGEKIEHYLTYKSHPGFQGIVFSALDFILPFTPTKNIIAMRWVSAFLSAITLALFCAWLAVEFGWLSATFVILFSAFSEWMILPAVNSYWSLWAFYLPFITALFGLGKDAKNSDWKIYSLLFAAGLVKVLFTGFEMITTAWIMATVPFVYHALTQKWNWKVLAKRLIQAGLVLSIATGIGLGVLTVQIAASDGGIGGAVNYILDTFARRASGNPASFTKGPYADAFQASTVSVIKIYLNINAFNTQTDPQLWQVPYWALIVLFVICTITLFVKYKLRNQQDMPVKGLTLVIATWYSMLAPLSWYILFKPTSYIHTFLFPMAWQMPFILLGFALCGYVIQDLLKARRW
jgi:hypothetical protein